MLQIYIGGCLIECNGCYFHGNMLTGIPVQYCYIVTKIVYKIYVIVHRNNFPSHQPISESVVVNLETKEVKK